MGSLESMPIAVNHARRSAVDGWLAGLGRLICPPRCLVCRAPGAGGRDLCAACADALPWNLLACDGCALPLPGASADGSARCGACLRRRSPLAATHAAFVYGFPVDRLLPRLKFHQDLASGRLLAQCMAEAFSVLSRPAVLVPVPLHRSRLRARGYDQALELARPVARALDIELRLDLVERHRATAPQSSLDAARRRRNLRGAFVVAPRPRLPDHVALVDDVMTTGATLHAAARALRRAGVARVDAWVCARVP